MGECTDTYTEFILFRIGTSDTYKHGNKIVGSIKSWEVEMGNYEVA
jgi:hypothetical protein